MSFFHVHDTHIPHCGFSETPTQMLIGLVAILKNNLMTSELPSRDSSPNYLSLYRKPPDGD